MKAEIVKNAEIMNGCQLFAIIDRHGKTDRQIWSTEENIKKIIFIQSDEYLEKREILDKHWKIHNNLSF